MEERNKINVHLQDISHLLGNNEVSVSKLISELQELEKHWTGLGVNNIILYITNAGYCDGDFEPELDLYGERLETDEEFGARLAREEKKRIERKEGAVRAMIDEYTLYKKLQAKYGDKI